MFAVFRVVLLILPLATLVAEKIDFLVRLLVIIRVRYISHLWLNDALCFSVDFFRKAGHQLKKILLGSLGVWVINNHTASKAIPHGCASYHLDLLRVLWIKLHCNSSALNQASVK